MILNNRYEEYNITGEYAECVICGNNTNDSIIYYDHLEDTYICKECIKSGV